jgi:superoxide reductase
MTKKENQVYRCRICGNMVEMLEAGKGNLTCCGQSMSWQEEGTVDAAREKHVPVVKRTDNGFKVMVGDVAHPMEEKHYIQFIELHAGDSVFRQNLRPGQPPEAEFEIDADEAFAREYCNLHGLWRS